MFFVIWYLSSDTVHQLQHFKAHRRTACQAVLWPLVPAGQDGWQIWFQLHKSLWLGISTGQWFRSLRGKLVRQSVCHMRVENEVLVNLVHFLQVKTLNSKTLEVNLKFVWLGIPSWLKCGGKEKDIWLKKTPCKNINIWKDSGMIHISFFLPFVFPVISTFPMPLLQQVDTLSQSEPLLVLDSNPIIEKTTAFWGRMMSREPNGLRVIDLVLLWEIHPNQI